VDAVPEGGQMWRPSGTGMLELKHTYPSGTEYSSTGRS